MRKNSKRIWMILISIFAFSMFIIDGLYMPQDADGCIDLRGVSPKVNANSGNVTVAKPSGTVENDIMIMAITTYDNISISLPVGWTIFNERNNGTTLRSTVAWKRAGASETSSYLITHSGGSSIIAAIASFSGVITSGDPIDTSASQANSSSSTVTAPSITTTVDRAMVIFTSHPRSDETHSNWSATNPSSFSEAFDYYYSTTYDVSVALAYAVRSTAGSTGTATASLSGSTLNNGVLFALKPQTGEIGLCGVSSQVNANSGNVTVAKPSGTVENDIMIMAITTYDNVSISLPVGWTIFNERNNGTTLRSTVAWKRAGASETSSYLITHSGGSSIIAAIASFSGVITSGDPIDTSASQANSSSSTVTAPSITTTVDRAMVIFTSHPRSDETHSNWSATNPLSFSEAFDYYYSTTYDVSVALAYAVRSTAGSTGTATATLSGWTLNNGVLFALKPQPADSTPPVEGTLSVSPESGTYVPASFTITETFTDNESAVTACEYTLDGSTWSAGTVSGSSPNFTCTATPPAQSNGTSLTIKMRATSTGGTSTPSNTLSRTVDAAAPTDGTLNVIPGNTQISLSWSGFSDGASGLNTTDTYKLVYLTSGYPNSTCSNGTDITDVTTQTSYIHTGLTNGTTYYYRLCAYDQLNNISSGATASATPTAGPTIIVGDGTDPSNVSLCPGDGATMLDAFTLQTNTGTDTVTAVQVDFAAGTTAGIGLVEINSDDGGTVYGSQSNPADPQNITLSTSINVTTSSVQYKVRITPKSHAAMPAPPGASYSVTGTVTQITSSLNKSYNDADSATVTIDNASPSNATWGTITTGQQQVTLNWTNPAVGDFNKVLILRKTSSISDAPEEGTIYAASGIIGTSTVVYVGNGTTFTDTGLTNGTNYYYKVFAYDNCINYATGGQIGPITPPGSPYLTYPASPYDDGINPDTGDTTTDFTFKVIYTDAENDPPAAGYPKIYIGDNDGYASYTMSLDTSAAASLKDGNYTNGEQYVYGPIGLGAASDLRFYFEAQASTGCTDIVRLPSDAPASFSTGPDVYLLDGYNMVGVPKNLGTGLLYASVLGDDSGYPYCITWESTGLDTGATFNGLWIDCTYDTVTTGRGYYIWSTDSNYWMIDEPSGVGNVTTTYFDIDLDPNGGWTMISNPYNSIIQLQNIKVVRSSTEYTFDYAVTNGWIDNSIYEYEGSVTGYAFSAYNGSPPATLKPWVGYFIYLKGATPTQMRIYAP